MIKSKFTGMYLVRREPRKPPIDPVEAIMKKILRLMLFCLKCRIVAVKAPNVLIPIFVPAVTLAEISFPKTIGNRTTPRTNPTRPPTKPIIKPRKAKSISEM